MKMDEFCMISNHELGAELRIGDWIKCKECKKKHKVEGGKDANGNVTDMALFYTCGDKTFLAGIQGKAILEVMK